MSLYLIPKLHLQNVQIYNLFKNPVVYRLSHQLANINNEVCEYPQIYDTSPEGYAKYQRSRWYDSVKAMPTVEEKLLELSIQSRPNLKKCLLTNVPSNFTGVHFNNYITRTHLVQGLPDKLTNIAVEKELHEIRDSLNEILLHFFHNAWEMNGPKSLQEYLDEVDTGSKFLNILISQCYKKMASRNDHIMESTIQNKPNIISNWFHAGFESKKDRLYEKNMCFLYEDSPEFVIRMKYPLSPILKLDDPLCATAEVPDYNYHPKVHGFSFDRKNFAPIPGFLSGDPYGFPLMSVISHAHVKELMDKLEKFNPRKIEESTCVISAFAYLNAIATYQGFTPFQDLTYPMVLQTILTNGQDYIFSVYQLNTIAFHEDVDNKDRRNICWISKKLRLFQKIEDGQIKGINDEVYKLLLKFLLNAPIPQENTVLSPYLGVDTRTEDEVHMTRYILRDYYNQRVEHYACLDEIPTWQWIYKKHPLAPPCPTVKME